MAKCCKDEKLLSMEHILTEIEDALREIDFLTKKLLGLSASEEPEVRLRSIEILQYIRRPYIENRIIESLSDDDELVRATCAEIIGSWKDRRYAANLIRQINDESWVVRSAIVIALAEIGVVSAIDVLEHRLRDAYDEERIALYFALCKLGRSQYLPLFLNGLFHEFYRIRCATANLSARIVTPANRGLILNLLSAVLKEESTKAAISSIQNAIIEINESAISALEQESGVP